MNLASVTVDEFTPLVGERFTLQAEEAGTLELELTAATPSPYPGPDGARHPFTLSFRGPVEPLLEQRIYQLEQSETGALEIFIVPIARDESGAAYEAVFN